MREHVRMEWLSLKHMPVFWLTRILFIALVICAGNLQGFVMMLGCAFSLGFVFDSEEECILPLTDEEMKRRRLYRVGMIWLRYLIVGLIGIAAAFLLPGLTEFTVVMREKRLLFAAFFVLQMALIYETMLENVTKRKHMEPYGSVKKFAFGILPTIVFFTYALSGFLRENRPFFYDGAEWIHVCILLVAAALLVIYCFVICREWKLGDFEPSKAKKLSGR